MGSAQVTDVLLPFIEYPGGKHNLARAGMIELKDKVIGQRSIFAFHSPPVTSNLALPT